MAGADGRPLLLLLAVCVLGVLLLHGAGRLCAVRREPARALPPFSGGLAPAEHPASRFHVRWYPVSLVFLAFDMEMLFMYPWVRVVGEMGTPAVVEMFLFLGILLAAVAYAWREGAFRWS